MSAQLLLLLAWIGAVVLLTAVVIAFVAGRRSAIAGLRIQELERIDRVWLERTAPGQYRVCPPSEYEQLLHEEWVAANHVGDYARFPVIFYARDHEGLLVKRLYPELLEGFLGSLTAVTQTPTCAGREAGVLDPVPAPVSPIRTE